MAYLIGTDEAGYGPNLGPLVISASVWHVPDGVGADDLFEKLGHIISQSIEEAQKFDPPRVVFADSKALYHSGGSLKHLERGLWAAWSMLGHNPGSWLDVWHKLACLSCEDLYGSPWFKDYDSLLPISGIITNDSELGDAMSAEGTKLLALRSRVVFPLEFNQLLEKYESKGALLSNLTLKLITQVMEPLEGGPISVVCDKHGGRNCYAPLLADHFSDSFIEIHGESRQQSVYRLGPKQRRIDFCFRTKAESVMPAALASMASKYLRELAMQAFNNFWCSRIPGLAPTAGYPLDARRFISAIAKVQRDLGIDDEMIWRVK